MAGHQLIDNHLARLARHLPADAVDELADGLTESWHRHLAAGLAPTDAAHAAIADFGTPDQTIRAFVKHSPGRRMARTLLATGPVMALCWGPNLIMTHAWAWPITPAAKAGYALTLVTVVAALAAAATSQRSLRRAASAPPPRSASSPSTRPCSPPPRSSPQRSPGPSQPPSPPA
jgi:hypothetical protein